MRVPVRRPAGRSLPLAVPLLVALVFVARAPAPRAVSAPTFGTAVAVVPAAHPEDDLDDWVEAIEDAGDAADPELLDRIAALGTREAFEALCELLPRMNGERLRNRAQRALLALHAVPELAPDVRAVLLEEALAAPRPEYAASAVSALLDLGDGALAELERVAAEHPDPAQRRRAADPLAPYLALRGDAAGLRIVLRNASLGHFEGPPFLGLDDTQRALVEGVSFREGVRTCLRRALTTERVPDFVRVATEPDTPRVGKLVLLRLLVEAGEVQLLERALSDADPSIVLFALDQLRAQDALAGQVQTLEDLQDHDDPAVRREALVAQDRLERADPGWARELLKRARDRDDALRMGAAVALAARLSEPWPVEAGERDAKQAAKELDALHDLLEDREWAVRVEALIQVGRLRDPRSVPLLVRQMEEEEGRLVDDVHDVLRLLTAQDHGRNPERWKAWWRAEGKDFELPARDEAEAAERARQERRAATDYAPAEFYGLPVVSRQVAFALDVSGSMREPAKGTHGITVAAGGDGPTRMDVAKRQLTRTLGKLEDGVWFDLIFFGSEVTAFDERPTKMAKKPRALAQRFVREQYAQGATALYPALQRAFAHPMVDTLYVLSDGAPTEGELTDPEEIRAEVARWNRARHLKIHALSIEQDSYLLQWLCEDSGGTYTRID